MTLHLRFNCQMIFTSREELGHTRGMGGRQVDDRLAQQPDVGQGRSPGEPDQPGAPARDRLGHGVPCGPRSLLRCQLGGRVRCLVLQRGRELLGQIGRDLGGGCGLAACSVHTSTLTATRPQGPDATPRDTPGAPKSLACPACRSPGARRADGGVPTRDASGRGDRRRGNARAPSAGGPKGLRRRAGARRGMTVRTAQGAGDAHRLVRVCTCSRRTSTPSRTIVQLLKRAIIKRYRRDRYIPSGAGRAAGSRRSCVSPPPRRGHRPKCPLDGRKTLSGAGDITPSAGPAPAGRKKPGRRT